MKDYVWALVIGVAFCTLVKGCTDYNIAREKNRSAVRIEAVKSGRSANLITCVINNNSAACNRASEEAAPK